MYYATFQFHFYHQFLCLQEKNPINQPKFEGKDKFIREPTGATVRASLAEPVYRRTENVEFGLPNCWK
jgi:hypothetical protein